MEARALLVRTGIVGALVALLLAVAFAVFAPPALAQYMPPSEGPIYAEDDLVKTSEGKSVVFNVLTNDYSTNAGEALTVTRVEQPPRGSVNCSFEGECTYHPAEEFAGVDIFFYRVCGDEACDEGMVTVFVSPEEEPPPNNAPVANDDTGSTAHATAKTFNVVMGDESNDYSGRDTDADESSENLYVLPFSVTPLVKVSDGTYAGTVTCNDHEARVYMQDCLVDPDPSVSGEQVKFTYKVEDSKQHMSNKATVTIDVGSKANTPPVAADDTGRVVQGRSVEINALANDSDPDGDALTLTSNTASAHGSVSCAPGGTCTYASSDAFSGTDSFSYTASDGRGGTDTGTVSITVDRALPDAQDDTGATTHENVPLKGIAVLSNDTGDDLQIVSHGQPANGTVSCATTCSYAPAAGHTGSDSFSYTVEDAHGARDTASVGVTVSPDDLAPTGTVVIDGGKRTTRDTLVLLALTGSDSGSGVAQMRFSNDGKAWGAWKPYAATSKWALKKGKAGTRTVFVQFADRADNRSAVAKDTIRYKP